MTQKNEQPWQSDRRSTNSRRYQIRQKMLSIGNDYTIENERGETIYKVDGKAGWQKKFVFEDAQGRALAMMKKHLISVKETIETSTPDGLPLAVVKKALITPLREHFTVSVENGPSLDIRGNLIDHEYTINDRQDEVASVSKKMFHVRDSYRVQIEAGQEQILILAIVVCIDEMTHSGN